MAGPKRQLFRQAALDRLSSPEQLDGLVTITDPLGWIGLAALLFLLLFTTGWGIFGSIPEQVNGKGILVSAGGQIVDAMSPAAGRISKLSVSQNAFVEAGDEIAVIEQSSLAESLRSAQDALNEKTLQRATLVVAFEKQSLLHQYNTREQVESQKQIMSAAQERSDYLQTTLAKREALAVSGILPRDRVEEIRRDYNRAQQEIRAAQVRILELEASNLEMSSQHSKELTQINQIITKAERDVRELESRLVENGRVLAPVSGQITELKVFAGEIIQTGASLASIATEGSVTEAVLYIPTKDGKRVTKGMAVRVSPSSAKKEEHGTIIGQIREVSSFPVTRKGMLTVLQNEGLVAEYSREGAPYATRVDLAIDPGSVSGFKWTSGGGPNIAITSGTTIEAEITVERQPPINLIIPFVRKHTGIGFLADQN